MAVFNTRYHRYQCLECLCLYGLHSRCCLNERCKSYRIVPASMRR